MSDKIQEIKEVLLKATPGPWEAYVHNSGAKVSAKGASADNWICQLWYKSEEPMENYEGNAHFIAKAPEYITYLLQEIERKEQESKRWEKAFCNADKQYLKQEKLAAQFRKENERLRMEIERKDEALRFYADEENYKVAITETDWGPIVAIDKDGGQRAREAL